MDTNEVFLTPISENTVKLVTIKSFDIEGDDVSKSNRKVAIVSVTVYDDEDNTKTRIINIKY